MLNLLILCIEIIAVIVILAIIIAFIGSYFSHIIFSLKNTDSVWVNYDEVMALLNVIVGTGDYSVRITLEDPAAPIANAIITYDEPAYATSRIVRVILGLQMVWIDNYNLILFPLSWVRYSIWFADKVVTMKKDFRL